MFSDTSNLSKKGQQLSHNVNVAVRNLSLTCVVKCASIDRPHHPQAACKPHSIKMRARAHTHYTAKAQVWSRTIPGRKLSAPIRISPACTIDWGVHTVVSTARHSELTATRQTASFAM